MPQFGTRRVSMRGIHTTQVLGVVTIPMSSIDPRLVENTLMFIRGRSLTRPRQRHYYLAIKREQCVKFLVNLVNLVSVRRWLGHT